MSHSTLPFEAAVAAADCANPLVAVADDSRQAKARVLAGFRQQFLLESPGTPNVDRIFEDLESVLGEYAGDLTAAEIADIRPRLHAVYRRIAFVSQQPNSGVPTERLNALRGLLTEGIPTDLSTALVHLRRLAMAVSDLLDDLLEDLR